jgi:hypothetical protein
MNITTPLPPDLSDPVGRDIEDAVIKEAKRRARRRRRRRIYATTALLALLGASLLVFFGRPGPPSQGGASDGAPALSSPAAPAGRDQAATIVARWGLIHRGWTLVYDDGRVMVYPDAGQVLERRLTAQGLDRVRSGAIQPRALLEWPSSQPADTWAAAEFTPYLPSRYAACYWWRNSLQDATQMLGRLPAPVQALLRGRERTYRNVDLVARPYDHSIAARVECSEVSAQEAPVVIETLEVAGFAFDDRPLGYLSGPCGVIERPERVDVCFSPVLPHGSWILWGG